MKREDAIKGYYTKEEVNAIIKEKIEEAGLNVNECSVYGVAEIKADNLNCFTDVDSKFNIEEDFVQVVSKLSFRASISRMGGNPTTDELMKVSEEIRNVANLIDKLNCMELEFVEIIDK